MLGPRAAFLILAALTTLTLVGCRQHPSTARQRQARRLLHKARSEFERGNAPQARRLLQRAVDRHPGLAPAHNLLGTLEYQAGQYNAAIAHLRRACKAEPSADAWTNLGAASAAAGKPVHAVQAYRQAIQADTHNPAPHLNLASLYQQLGQPDATLKQMNLALRLFPENPKVRLAYAHSLLLAGHRQEAAPRIRALARQYDAAALPHLAHALNAIGEEKAAMKRLQAAVQANPDDPRLRIALADSLLNAGQLDDAERQGRAAASLSSGTLAPRLTLGEILLRKHKPGAALPLLEQAVHQAPLDLHARALLGDAYVATDQKNKTLRLHRQSVKLLPNNPLARRLLADALMLDAQFVKAAAAYRRALALGHASSETRTRLVDAYAHKGQMALALSELANAAAEHPDDPAIQLRLATFAASRRDTTTARDAFQQALKLAPNDPKVHLATGNWHRSENRLYRAIEHYRRAVEFAPQRLHAHLGLADSLERLQRHAQAAKHYRQAAELDSRALPAWMGLARCALAQRKLQKAKRALDHARALPNADSQTNAITDLQQRLAKMDSKKSPTSPQTPRSAD